MVWAAIKKMPFPLRNREFVARQVAATDINDDFLVVAVSTDEVIDYGMNTNTVRGVSKVIMRLAPEGHERCKLTYHKYLDSGGQIPAFVVNAKLPLALGVVGKLRDAFQRDDEIDKVERDELTATIRDSPQTYTAEEDILINDVNVKLGVLEWEHFEVLESPDHLVKMGKIFVQNDSSGVMRGIVTVDAPLEECAAWEMAKMSRENRKQHLAFGGLERCLNPENGHHNVYHMVYDLGIRGFQPREFLLTQIWKLQEDRLVVGYKSLEHADFPLRPQYVRATSRAMWVYETVQQAGNTPQTRVTYSCQIDLGGVIPKLFVNRGAVSQLAYLSTMRQQFDKSMEINEGVRARNVDMIMGHDGAEYSEEENRILAEGEQRFADFQDMKVKNLKMASPLTTAKIAYKSGDMHAWGWAATTARASPEEVLAFMWDTMRRSTRREDDLEKSVEEQANGHNMLVYNKKRSPKILSDRDFLGRCVWKKEGEGFVYVTSPEESEARPIADGVVRGKFPSAMKIKRENDKETTIEFVVHLDAGGLVPSFIMSRYLGSNLRRVTEIQEYFQELRKMEDYEAADGKALGVRLMHPGGEKGKKPWQKVGDVMEKHQLKKLSLEFDWLGGFLEEVVRGRWVTSGSVSTKLECLSENEARKIGRSLMPALKQRKTALAGVHQWKMQNRSMVELFERYDWVESVLLTVAQEVMKTAPWGLMWRVCTGAYLSVLDIVTDVVVIVGYMGKEETRGYGYSLLMMLVGSMVLQLLVVFAQNRKKPWAVAKEMLVVITGLKPAW